MRFDRAGILRTAHAAARKQMTPHHSWRYGDTWEAGRGWVPKFGYRVAFGNALRTAWRDAKSIALNAEIEAELALEPQIPAAIAERTSAMRLAAWYEPITAAGTARMREIYDEADEIDEAARLNVIAAQQRFQREPTHVAC